MTRPRVDATLPTPSAASMSAAERADCDHFRHVWDALDDPIFIHDEAFRLTRANRAYWQAAGRSENEALGQPYWQVFPVGAGPFARCARLSEGHCGGCREELRSEARTFMSRGYPLPGGAPDRSCSLHVLSDITELKRAEASLRERQAWAQTILDAAPVAMLLMDDQGRIVQANNRAEAMFGHAAGVHGGPERGGPDPGAFPRRASAKPPAPRDGAATPAHDGHERR